MASAPLPEGPGLLLCAGHEFFVAEAAREVRRAFEEAGAEIERLDEAEVPAKLASALTAGSLFSDRRLVEADLSLLFGRQAPAELWEEALAAWNKGTPAGRRETFRKVRTLLVSLRVADGSPEEQAAAAAKKLGAGADAAILSEIVREMPESKLDAASARDAVLRHLARGDSRTFLLGLAVDPPREAELFSAFRAGGLVREVPREGEERRELMDLAKRFGRERGVVFEPGFVEALLNRTEASPRLFASELEKLVEFAKPGAALSAADVADMVEDRRAEDIYAFTDLIGRRRLREALEQLSRMLSGRPVAFGERLIDSNDPARVILATLTTEVRRMLIARFRAAETGVRLSAGLSPRTYEASVHPRLSAAPAPGLPSAMPGKPYLWFKVCERASSFSAEELSRALRLCARADAASKDSAALSDILPWLVAEICSPPAGAVSRN